MFKKFNNTIKIRLFVQFIQGLIMKAIMPFMALYFTDLYNPIYAGFILATTVIINFLITFYGGYIGDILSRKKIIIITQLGVIITLIGMMGSFFLEHKLLLFTLSYISFKAFINSGYLNIIFENGLNNVDLDKINEIISQFNTKSFGVMKV
ncbi:hypothetical protein [Macrococcus psychrotolerans]|uniref:MFS transporter n=1 Tax=Macrococcus psychrotolerans TaxID=3039389 RepID=A0AAU6RPF4_9STAP